MSRYDDEEFLPWYRKATVGWLELSATARGVLVSVSMELSKSGRLHLRKGLPSLSVLLRLPWDVIEPAIAELIAAGKLVWDGSSFTLSDPDYETRKRPTSAERVAKHRARRTSTNPPCNAGNVTSVTPVTDPPCNVGNVTSILVSSDLISDPEDPTKTESAGARVETIRPPPFAPEGPSEVREVSGPTPESKRAPDPLPGAGNGHPVGDLDRHPAWWPGVIETVESNTGEKLRPAEAWLRYSGHRHGKRLQPDPKDACYWLSTVMVREARDERHKATAERERQRARAGPADPPQQTAEELKELHRKFPPILRKKVPA